MIIWEELTIAEKQAIKYMSEHSFEMFMRIWFNVIQGQEMILNWHHAYLCKMVDEILEGERRDTIFNVTPGSGKTEIFSVHLPVYSMIKLNKVRNLNLSFADSLVKRNSKRVREIITSKEFQELWPCKFGTMKDDEIQVKNGSDKIWFELISKAIGGQVTGSRGGYMTPGYSGMVMLDDVDKPDDMWSSVKRTKIHNLLTNTVRSRRMREDTPVISVQQRLHAQDSTWYMMQGGMGIDFEQISIPALVTDEYKHSLPEWLHERFESDVLSSEPVEIGGVKHYSFWPAKESVSNLIKLREADPYTFESQYQQQPFALGGKVFEERWWGWYGSSSKATEPAPGKFDYRIITADTAQKTGERNDYSVFVCWGLKNQKAYFIDAVRGKMEAPELRDKFEMFVRSMWSKNREEGTLRKVYVEDKASGTGLIQDLAKKLPMAITPVQRNKDKGTRAKDAQTIVAAGRIVLPDDHPMMLDFITEHSQFTYDDSHPHDDIVDNTMDVANLEMLTLDDPVARMKKLAGVS